MLKVLAIEAERIRKLKLVNLKLNGENLVVAGEPNEGKTTLINLLWMAIESKKVGREVIQAGEKEGYISIQLGEPGKPYTVKVTRKFTEKSGEAGRLKVESGNKKPLPADFLKDMVHGLTFDPIEFLRQKGQEQVNMLLSVSDVSIQKLEDIEEQRSLHYTDRTAAKRELQKWESIVGKEPTQTDRIDIQELTDKMAKIKIHNDQYDKGINLLESLQTEVALIEKEIEERQERVTDLEARIEIGLDKMDKLERFDETEYIEKLKNIQAINIKAEAWEAWGKNSQILKGVALEVEDLESKMAGIEAQKKDILSKAKWPVSGMEIRDGEIYVENILLKNCGVSQKLQVSFAVAISTHPELKCCRLDGAESLGTKGRKEVIQMANQQGYQILMSRVSDDGAADGELLIEAGVVKT